MENKNNDKALNNEELLQDDELRKKSIRVLKRALICLENPDCKLCPFADAKMSDCLCDSDEAIASAYAVAIHAIEEQIENENENI